MSDEQPDASQVVGAASELNKYATEYIKLADQKAVFCIGLMTGILALLYGAGAHKAHQHGYDTREFLLAWTAIILDLIACGFALRTVLPRLRSPLSIGVIYWADVAGTKCEDYTTKVLEMKWTVFGKALLEHFHVLSTVCTRKYITLWWSMCVGSGGVVSSLAFILFFGK